MRKFLAALAVVLALGVVVASNATAEFQAAIVTKKANWPVWGPTGTVGTASDTSAAFDGAVQDTTGAIYIGDMAFGQTGLTVGPGAFTAMNALKVTLVADGLCDNVDSLYYRIEHSIDGQHWIQGTAANNLNNLTGVIAGVDQGNTVVGTTNNCELTFFVKADLDLADGTAPATAATFNTAWAWAPFIRVVIRSMASDVFLNTKLWVSYPGFREVH